MNNQHRKTFLIYLRDVVEPQLIDIFGSSNNTSPVVRRRQLHDIISTHRIQSRRLFFFKNFLVRYLRYLFENGMLEVTVILMSPCDDYVIKEIKLDWLYGLTIAGYLDIVT